MANNHLKIHKGITLRPQASEPSNPVDGDMYYDDTLNKFRKYENGVWADFGSGATGITNHIPNSDIENDASEYNTYDDGAVDTPVDGTAGSPSVITIARTSTPSETLRGTGSLEISKSAADGQGEGVSIDFASDLQDDEDHNGEMEITFNKQSSADYESGDLRVFIYDVTNDAIINVTNFDDGDVTSSNGIFRATFLTTDSLSYRLILHTTSTNASAWDVSIDCVRVGPALAVPGMFADGWIDHGPTLIESSGTAHAKGGTIVVDKLYSRRIGDSLQVRGAYRQTTAGTPGTGYYKLLNPRGVKIDVNKIDAFIPSVFGGFGVVVTNSNVGSYTGHANGVGTAGNVSVGDEDHVYLLGQSHASLSNSVEILGGSSPRDFANAAFSFHFEYTIPIDKWDVGAILSPDEVEISIAKSEGLSGSVTANVTNISWTTEIFDTRDEWDGTTFIPKRTGHYDISGAAQYTVSGIVFFDAYIDAVQDKSLGNNFSLNIMNFAGSIFLLAGQSLTFRSTASKTFSGGVNENWISITENPDFRLFSVVGKKHVAVIKDVKSTGTQGGTFTAGAYRTRDLNTFNDTGIGITLLSNQFTLPAGKYKITGFATANGVQQNKTRIQNMTDVTTAVLGKTSYSQTSPAENDYSNFEGIVDISSTKTFELQHQSFGTIATSGFGRVVNALSVSEDETYAVVIIEKLG